MKARLQKVRTSPRDSAGSNEAPAPAPRRPFALTACPTLTVLPTAHLAYMGGMPLLPLEPARLSAALTKKVASGGRPMAAGPVLTKRRPAALAAAAALARPKSAERSAVLPTPARAKALNPRRSRNVPGAKDRAEEARPLLTTRMLSALKPSAPRVTAGTPPRDGGKISSKWAEEIPLAVEGLGFPRRA